jgi:hypothetical protein
MQLPAAEAFLSRTFIDPCGARTQFPVYRLVSLVSARFDMDEVEASVFANASGKTLAEPPINRDMAFDRQLRIMIERYALASLFSDGAPGRYHHEIRPVGYDYYADAVDPRGMEKWRADYRAMTAAQQMLAASIIWLYRGGKDNVWLRRVPCTWHATDAVLEMQRSKALADWGYLISLYPGW